MKLIFCKYDCSNCKNHFKAPEISGAAFGEFLLRSSGASEIRYLNALDDPTYEEVSKLMLMNDDVAALSAVRRAKILQEIYGPVACDRDAQGQPYQLGVHPACPTCATQSMSNWEFTDPPEFIDIDILPVTHLNWSMLSNESKRKLVQEMLINTESIIFN
jgi:hypothetical protein